MSGVNKVILVGNLGRDPEVFTFENGNKKVSFSLATTEAYKNKEGQRVEQTEWHNIVVYRGLADIAMNYLKKGSSIYLEGKIRTRSWDENGAKKYMTEIEAQTFTMLGRKPDGSSTVASTLSSGDVDSGALEPPVFDPPTDDLPF